MTCFLNFPCFFIYYNIHTYMFNRWTWLTMGNLLSISTYCGVSLPEKLYQMLNFHVTILYRLKSKTPVQSIYSQLWNVSVMLPIPIDIQVYIFVLLEMFKVCIVDDWMKITPSWIKLLTINYTCLAMLFAWLFRFSKC